MTVTVAVEPERYHNSPAPAPRTFTHRQILTILGGLMLGILLAALDQTIVSTAIRTIADDLHGLKPAGVGDDRLPDHCNDLHSIVWQAV
jgi:hypothetical protein